MSEFVGVMWSDDELITATKMNQMASNDKFLLDRTLKQSYRAYDLNKTDGLRIATGIQRIEARASREARMAISFNGFFTQGCRPSIQCTLAITDQVRSFVTIRGNGADPLRPDHTGFTVVVNADPVADTKNFFPTAFHVHWFAVGY